MNLQSYVIANILNKNPTSNRTPNNISLRTPNLSTIPKNAFGVFCTIRRSQKLPTYPEDIHGCIGYWSPDYSTVPPKALLQHLIDVGHSAMYKDDRRTYFPPIETDTNAIIEIDFMLLPTIPINPVSGQLENGDQFANSKYGLIVSDNSNMSRATFLPHVFPDTISWQDIKGKVISKAGATTSNTNNKFLAYQIKQIKARLFDIVEYIKSRPYRNTYDISYTFALIDSFLNFMYKSMKELKYIPYEVSRSNSPTQLILKQNEDEAIRNFSSLETVIRCQYKIFKSKLSNEIIDIARNTIITLYKNMNQNDYQALANYISLICVWNKYLPNKYSFKIQIKHINILINRIPNAEETFERGQIVLAIIEYFNSILDTKNNKIINKKQGFVNNIVTIYETINYNITKSNKSNLEKVFKMNWDSQVLCALLKNNNDKNIEPSIIKQIIKIVKAYKILFKTIRPIITELETNYQAVIFEGSNTLLQTIKSIKNNKQDITFDIDESNLQSIVFISFLEIIKRWENGLLYFTNNTARIDITGHMMNGILNVLG